jgi:muconolactone delta-isomerase
MISWFERPQGSPTEYENAQKRILEVFTKWKAPANFKIELFVVRVGEWGGHMLVDCDDPATVHKACSTFPAFEFQVRPVIPVEEAVTMDLKITDIPVRGTFSHNLDHLILPIVPENLRHHDYSSICCS